MSKVLYDADGGLRVLTINRPEVHNCIDAETAAALTARIDEFASDTSARALIVTGAGERAFCTGADLKDAAALSAAPRARELGPLGFSRLDPGKPVIAAVEGFCYAGGMELAAWCDFRIAGESATFGALNRRFGVPFLDGGTRHFAQVMGMGGALYVMETGVLLGAAKAQTLGLVQEVVAGGEALDRALALAGRITGYPQASLLADRRACVAGWGTPSEEAFALETRAGWESLSDPEMQARIEAFARAEAPRPPDAR